MEPTTDGSPPNSMYMVRCGEMFPKPSMEKEDDKLAIPFKELPGEGVKYIGETTDGVLALTNYRIFVLRGQQEKSVPLGLIDTVQSRDLFHLIVNCKDANTVKCSFETTEKCSEWQRRITSAVSSLISLNSLFAFPFYAWSSEQSELLQHQQRALSSASRSSSPAANNNNNNNNNIGNGTLATIATEAEWSGRLRKISSQDYDEEFRKEVERLQFNLRGAWRISKVNEDFKLCPSYPRHFLVPTYITDETLQSVANFRSSRRIPVAVWRHRTTGAIIARCSQPEVGWLGWRNNKDEELLQAFVNACAFDQGEQQQQNQNNQLMVIGDGNSVAEWGKDYSGKIMPATNGSSEVEAMGNHMNNNRLSSTSEESMSSSPEGSHEEVRMDKPKKMLIVDARSYASAVTNRARGGGCECIDYYPSAEIQFMNLANIHAVRKSFNSLRQLCASAPDMGSWLSNLEKTLWLQHLSGLLAASVTVTRMIEVEGRPVLVHCSDGWDRTPQIVATAQLCLDPYYRTVNGFKTLVEREWLSFGHKYGDRCGHGPNSYELNERCPVFLQWLDCVHQIHNQFPCSFEFSVGYLIKLAQHSNSGLFGTFLTNTMRERIENSIFDRTYSVWPFLSGPMYKNPLYVPNRATVLWPAYNIRDLTLWNEVYLGNLHTNQAAATAINADALGTKMETMRMESVEDGEDKMDMVMGALRLEVDGEEEEDDVDSVEGDEERTPKHTSGEPPVSPMSKTRSYNDLLESSGNGGGSGPHRRCSDPTMPIELIKQNGLLQQQQGEKKQSQEKDKQMMDEVETRELTTRCDNKDALMLLPNGTPGVGGGVLALDRYEKGQEEINGVAAIEYSSSNEHIHSNRIMDTVQPQLLPLMSASFTNGLVTGGGSVELALPPVLNVIPAGVLEEVTGSCDSVDGSPSPPLLGSVTRPQALTDVMLESVDLRCASSASSSESHNFAGLSPELGQGKSALWYGNVETSTDTLVPTNAVLTEEESKHFSGSNNVDLSNFLTKREENEEMRPQRIVESEGVQIPNGIDCSVFGEDSFNNMDLLANQSVYDPLTTSTTVMDGVPKSNDNNLHLMDLSLMESAVIQSQPLSKSRRLQRHRRTPSNSKSEPSPQKFQNGNMSPSATMNSRFSTPGGRSPNLTPPEVNGGGGVGGPGAVFEKANNVILSCPDGLAHALSEQNIRLQQLIYEHKLREESLQRELNATRMALLKRSVCYQCNVNQDPSSNHEEQNTNLMMDAGENISVCSWEAVEEREGSGSGASSVSAQSDQMATSNNNGHSNSKVLWVPDHAVNKCTGCSFEFWLGRRKHHCRSCGKIFCSDCSEFFAALPEERLYNPVRLCAPCYLAVTQSQHEQQQQQQQYQNQNQETTTKRQLLPSHQMINSSSAANHKFSHSHSHQQPPPSSTASSSSSASPSPSPLTTSSTKMTLATRNGSNGMDSVVIARPAPLPPPTGDVILRNNSSCSLEMASAGVLDRDGPLSVSEGGGAKSTTNGLVDGCNLKTATASN